MIIEEMIVTNRVAGHGTGIVPAGVPAGDIGEVIAAVAAAGFTAAARGHGNIVSSVNKKLFTSTSRTCSYYGIL